MRVYQVFIAKTNEEILAWRNKDSDISYEYQ